jgi:hypothetical protein
MRSAVRAKDENALVLLVEPEEAEQERFAAWLEAAGIGVMVCPGPQRVDFTCLGVRGQRCGLVEIADLAIVDVRVFDGAYQEHTPSRELLRCYLRADKPILLLGPIRGSVRLFTDVEVGLLERPTRRFLVSAVRRLLTVSRAKAAAASACA